jgi:hypothetical protein
MPFGSVTRDPPWPYPVHVDANAAFAAAALDQPAQPTRPA